MKNILKRPKKNQLLPGLLFLSGCSDNFLNVPPQKSQPNQEFWKTESDATKAVNAIYANLRAYNQVAFAPIAVESMGSDDAEKGSSPSDASFMNSTMIIPSPPRMDNCWIFGAGNTSPSISAIKSLTIFPRFPWMQV